MANKDDKKDFSLISIDPAEVNDKFINNEDLNIYVELEAHQRVSGVIVNNLNDNSVSIENTGISSSKFKFVDYTDKVKGDERFYHNTLYTEVNTSFNLGNDKKEIGYIGLEDIQITFNESMVPTATITMKDLRGDIFNNADDSPYRFLFNVDRPIFYLTVKGPYGNPVKYALKLIDFSSKFESSTGSFSITTKYIGYTYAFLSDLIVGHLKSVPCTDLGQQVLDDLGFNDFPLIDDYVDDLKSIEDKIKVVTESREQELVDLTDVNTKLTILDGMIDKISSINKDFGDKINDIDYSLEGVAINYGYYIGTSEESDNKREDDRYDKKGTKRTYNILYEAIKEFNETGDSTSNFDYKIETAIYKKITLNMLNNDKVSNKYPNLSKVTQSESVNYYELKKKINSLVNDNTSITKDTELYILDLRNLKDKCNIKKQEITKEKDKVEKDFRDNINSIISESVNTEDISIEKVVGIVTKHADLLMRVLLNIGNQVRKDIDSGKRSKLFETLNANQTDYKSNNVEAFPEYAEKKGDTLELAYIGSNPTFKNLPEVKFIENLSECIRSSSEDRPDLIDFVLIENTMPLTIRETSPFGSNFVNIWDSGKLNRVSSNKSFKIIAHRIISYLGTSNFNPSKEEINLLSSLESVNIKNTLDNGSLEVLIANFEKLKEELFNGRIGQDGVEDLDGILKIYDDPEKEDFLNMININESIFENLKDSTELYTYKSNRQRQFNLLDNLIPLSYINDKLLDSDILNDKFCYQVGSICDYEDIIGKGIFSSEKVGDRPSRYSYISFDETFIKIINESEYNSPESIKEYDPTTESYVEFLDNGEISNSNINTKYGIPEMFNVKSNNTKDNTSVFKTSLLFYDTKGKDSLTIVRKTRSGIQYIYKKPETLVSKGGEVPQHTTIKDLLLAKKGNSSDIETNIINRFKVAIPTGLNNDDYHTLDLFGSKLYREQAEIGKAFLFLHTIPFSGFLDARGTNNMLDKGRFDMGNSDKFIDWFNDYPDWENTAGLLSSEYRKLFNIKHGFVKVPYSWVLFMGAILHRYIEKEDIITYVDSDNKSLISDGIIPPNKRAYINYDKRYDQSGSDEKLTMNSQTSFGFHGEGIDKSLTENNYMPINFSLASLPKQIKESFINEFLDWVKSDFRDLVNGFEVTATGEYDNNVYSKVELVTSIGIEAGPRLKHIKDLNGENFVLTKVTGKKNDYDVKLLEFLDEDRIIANSNYRVWNDKFMYQAILKDTSKSFESDIKMPLVLDKIKLDEYLNSLLNNLKTLNSENEEENLTEIGKLNSLNDLKLKLYNNIKGIYDRWIIDNEDTSTLESIIDYNKFNSNLLDSFAFIDRGYNHIGTKLLIPPKNIYQYFDDMGDNNVYSFLSNLFSKNNILFLPLPNFVDFKNRKDFEDVFKPQKFVKDNTYNPRFICMYMGEVSSRLNIKSDKYNDDSLSLSEEQPDDFINGDKLSSIPNFEVNFGDPKQTMFTNIELDQKEFTETDESFTIQNDLANNKSSVGLNLFDIYKVRSYSTTIDMLGCAQIQPFMYFDITNIPMFKGSYMIIKVDHSIKANTMDTKFKGVRIKKQKTKLVDLDTILYNYIEQFITERGNSLNSNLAPEDYLTFYNESKVNEYTESLKTSLKINKDNYLGNPIDYYDGLIITSLIGLRKTNVTGSSGTRVTPHKGIDLRGEQGVSNIKNVYDGYLSRVRLSLKFKSGELDKSGAAAAAGLYVETTHPYSNGQFKCRYMHMSKLDENIIPEDFKTTYRETFKDYLKIKDTYTYDSEDIDLNKIITSKKTFKFDYDNQRKIKTLKKGDVLGKVGGSSNHIFSGGSGGTHLHFDMRLENILTWSNTENKAKYVDPREFFKDVKLKDGLPLSDV